MNITRLNIGKINNIIKNIYSDIIGIVYLITIEEPYMIYTFIKTMVKDRLNLTTLYKTLNTPLEGSSTKVFVQTGTNSLALADKVSIRGNWYYIIDGNYINELQLVSRLRVKKPIKFINNDGTIINDRYSEFVNDKEWVECTLKLNNSGKCVKVVVANAIDSRLFSHLIKSVRQGTYSRNNVSYKSRKISVVLYNILTIFSTNRRLEKSIVINYDPLRVSAFLNTSKGTSGQESNVFPRSLLFSYLSFFRSWVVSVVLSISVVSSLYFLRDIPVNKFLFSTGSLVLFLYLLISGFVFFIKKYRYGKYTTAMHRFWRRSFSIFWALEGFLFIVFMYLTVLANQEPFFMYDNSQFFKTYTYSWRLFISENSIILAIVSVLHYVVIRYKDITSFKLNLFVILVTLIYFFLTYIEFYQFFYTISHYNPTTWAFDYESNKWVLDFETTQTKRTRVLLHFITICLIAKFWHFVFILVFWVFTVSKLIQLNTLSYQLLGANLQNAIILYLLNWILMYPWLKVAFRKFLFRHYRWLYVHFRSVGLRVAFNDLLTYYTMLLDFVTLQLIELKMSWLFLYYSITGSDLLRSDFFAPAV